ncbi:MAG: Gamma-glutamyltranspeptidase [Solirubrobacterales bacterium]|nr:Gamma-glutamyltranspeptidase [Solirubrobacterales bacterium]
MSARVRPAVLVAVLLTGVLPILPATATTTTTATAPTCLTPVAADGFEPPCNPFLSSPAWAGSHRSSFAQASSPYPAPEAGDAVRVDHVGGLFGVPLIFSFTEPYGDGGRNAWASTVATPDGRYVYKVDVQSGRVISSFGVLNDGRLPGAGGVSGAYNVLDRDNHLIVGRGRSFDVYGDATPGDRFSPVARLGQFTLPGDALCGPDDTLVGITMLFDGRIAFASALGVVGTIPREPERMTAANLVTTSLNGDRCATATAQDSNLDQVSNSIAADERGGIFVVTSKAMYRVDWDGTALRRTWRAPYASGSHSAVRIGEGSGSTPTLMGTSPTQDRFVVITDGQELVHLDLFWRDQIPTDWRGLPGKDRRLACEVPITFGDPGATTTQNEQSVLVRGYASVIPNNQLRDDSAFRDLPGNARQIAAALAGGDPGNAPHGVERIDWDPKTRTCAPRWANRRVSLPNGIPSMSTASGLMYGIGQRDGIWGLEGLDFATGESRLRIDTSASPDQNSAYAATTIGPDGAIWTGTLLGYTIYRGPVRPAPALACLDLTAPSSRVRIVNARGVPHTVLTRKHVSVTGPARDRACGGPAHRVARVDVSVQQRVAGGCRGLTTRGRLLTTARPCSRRVFLRAKLAEDGRRYLLRLPAHLPAGRYLVVSRATDARGNQEERPTPIAARVR